MYDEEEEDEEDVALRKHIMSINCKIVWARLACMMRRRRMRRMLH